jgi:hypothetical protein
MEMGTRTDQARDEVIAARQGLLDEADGMRRSALEAVNLPAKARDDPLRYGALAAGGAFVALGGPRRLLGRVRRAVLGAPTPKSLLPEEIEKAVQGMGKDSKAVKQHLEREFADYLEERRAEREHSSVTATLLGVGGSFVSAFGERAARRIAQELIAPRERRDESPRVSDEPDGPSGRTGTGRGR